MHTIAAKFGALAVTPFLFFGGHGQVAQSANVNGLEHRSEVAQVKAKAELSCTDLTNALYYGLRDEGTDGEVSKLQTFLRAQGYLNSAPTGTFGASTVRAVQAFQSDHDIQATGFVGAKTRAEIKSISCEEDQHEDFTITSIDGPTGLAVGKEGTWTVHVEGDVDGNLRYAVKWGDEGFQPLSLFRSSAEATQASATFTHTYDRTGTYKPEFTVTDESGQRATKVATSVVVGTESIVRISSTTPSSGPVGTMVTLGGYGFKADGTTVTVGGKTADSIEIKDDSKITFMVPSIDPGKYYVRVTNNESGSNRVWFTVTAPSGRLSISGIDAPAKLAVNESGTWTVHADSNMSGNLHYAVVWGDEATSADRMMAASLETTQSSATFTHAYAKADTYTPTFTVSDDYGHSATVSASVIVTAP
ncbi:MAG: peptidoglycan-binding protein [Minisyncoccia bacterium]